MFRLEQSPALDGNTYSGVNLIKHLQDSVPIVLEAENNNYSSKHFIKLTPGLKNLESRLVQGQAALKFLLPRTVAWLSY